MARRPRPIISSCSGSCSDSCTAHVYSPPDDFVVCWHRDCTREATHEVDVYANGVKVATRPACTDHRRAVREAPLVISSVERMIP